MTREEAKEIFLNRGFVNGIFDGDKWRQSVVVISDWLKQEPILDKIRAEIEAEKIEGFAARNGGLGIAIEIIDKYRKEQK